MFAESQNPDANWTPQVHEKTPAEMQRISAALASNKFSDLFQSFTTDEMERFISYMEKEDFVEGHDIMVQGDQGDYFYVRARTRHALDPGRQGRVTLLLPLR